MDNQVSQYQSLPGNMLYNNLISNIEQGQIKIPQFQRKFVWSIEETAGLIDSILKGYPIGTFIIWETNDRLRSVRNIGNFQFPDTPDGNTVQYVLDGQQRMTSLYVALRGAKLEDDNGQITDYSEIYVNLSAKSDDSLVLTDKTGYQDTQIIRFVDLLNGSLSLLLSKYKILNNEQPVYDVPIDTSVEFIRNHGYFSAGSAFIKGMLCLLAYQQPVSYQNNGIVHIANDWLKQANSKNYHHFFPKAYMRKAHPEVDDWLVNHIGNITIVDDFLNKRSIRDRAPSKYISEYMAQNPNLEKALNSHLISAASGWGVLEDDYQTFFQNRLNWFCEELNKRVIVTQADRTA
jgi:hypothetical protein